MSSAQQQTLKSQRYHALKNRLFFVYLFLDIIIFGILLVSGLSVAVKDFYQRLTDNFYGVISLYLIIVGLGATLIHFPLNFLEGYIWEHRFKLSNQKFFKWLWDNLKEAMLGGFIAILAIEALYAFLRNFPSTWWIYATIFWLFLSLVLARLMPTVLIPIFYKYSDIENQELKDRILELFKRCGLTIKNAYAINFSTKTKKANAMICGLGNNRRVVLADNLLNQFSPDEIETVVAHEIGHYQHHDIMKLTLVNSIVTFFCFFVINRILQVSLIRFGFNRIDDIAFFPMIVLGFITLSFFMMPLLNTYSRHLETQADLFSVTITRKPKDLISAFQKLGEINLAEFEPSPATEILFYSHPPLRKRIKFIESLEISDNRHKEIHK